jgi:hypothetical protein
MRDKSESTYGEKKSQPTQILGVYSTALSFSSLCVFVFLVSNKNSNWPRHKKIIIFPRRKSGKKKSQKSFPSWFPRETWHTFVATATALNCSKRLAPFQQQPVLFCVWEKKSSFRWFFYPVRVVCVCVCGVWTHLAAFLDTFPPSLLSSIFFFCCFLLRRLVCVCVCVCLLEL